MIAPMSYGVSKTFRWIFPGWKFAVPCCLSLMHVRTCKYQMCDNCCCCSMCYWLRAHTLTVLRSHFDSLPEIWLYRTCPDQPCTYGNTETLYMLWLCHHIHFVVVTAALFPQGSMRSGSRTALTTHYCGPTTRQGIVVHLMNVVCCARRCDDRGKATCPAPSGDQAPLFWSVTSELSIIKRFCAVCVIFVSSYSHT